MPGREQKDAVISVIAEITQLQRGNVSWTVNLGNAFLNTLCGYFLKGQEVNTEQGACVKATGNFLDHSFGCEYQNWPVISLKCNTPTHMYLSGGEDGVVG